MVTHAFAIKILFYLFAPEQLCAVEKVKNAAILRLIYDEGNFIFKKWNANCYVLPIRHRGQGGHPWFLADKGIGVRDNVF